MRNRQPVTSRPVVVVVNDDPTQCLLYAGLLRKQDIDVQTFERAEDALVLMHRAPPDLLVTDVNMPVIDGWRFCRLMRSEEYACLNAVPILVISATFSGDEPREIAINLGADAFLQAPIDGGQFMSVVTDLLQNRSTVNAPNVLIVEESRTLAEILKNAFEAKGYRANSASTVKEAMEAVRSIRYDLAILDYIAPGGTGDQLLDWLQAKQPECILMMTGEPDFDLALDWMKRGAVDYLRKPFAPEFLLELCARARREHSLMRSVDLLQARTEQLLKSEKDYKNLFNKMLEGIAEHEIICDEVGRPVDYRFLAVNPAFERLTGLRADEVVGRSVRQVLPATEPSWIETYGRVALTGEPALFESYSGELKKHFEVTAFQTGSSRFACIFQDVTEQKEANEENQKLQNQVRQTQKLDSIGRLAGGVAHDFNNMLGVILGNTEMAMEIVTPDEEMHVFLQEIYKAAERSAKLTRQLLAFARKETITPCILDLNATIADMCSMLKRLIGESIDLAWQPGAEICPVKMDPSQVDQVLANLCVNARDAIAECGRVVVSTQNCTVNASDCVRYPDAVPGDYVRLTVSDTGIGMDGKIVEHLFEPFFTTKKPGMGTGLGLATVYGIVRQNNGFITVQTTLGQGSEFSIYIPCCRQEITHKETREVSIPLPKGKETVLIVEDEPAMLELFSDMVGRLGYQVLKGATPAEAIELAKAMLHEGQIDLLLSDVIMPKMNGRALAKNIQSLYPNIRCIFMSGYSAEFIVQYGVLDPGVHFLQKPVSMKRLAEKLREALEENGAEERLP